MPQNLLEGPIDHSEITIEGLKKRLAYLENELLLARAESRQVLSAVAVIREQLSPLYQGLSALFGKIDQVPGVSGSDTRAGDDRVRAAWDQWKRKLPPILGKFIDSFLTHGEQTQKQLAITVPCNLSNVPTYLSRMNKLALIQKNGNLYSLRKL